MATIDETFVVLVQDNFHILFPEAESSFFKHYVEIVMVAKLLILNRAVNYPHCGIGRVIERPTTAELLIYFFYVGHLINSK